MCELVDRPTREDYGAYMVGEPQDEYDPEADAVVKEHLLAIEDEIRGAGQIEGRRIVRRVKAWASQTESALIQDGDTD